MLIAPSELPRVAFPPTLRVMSELATPVSYAGGMESPIIEPHAVTARQSLRSVTACGPT